MLPSSKISRSLLGTHMTIPHTIVPSLRSCTTWSTGLAIALTSWKIVPPLGQMQSARQLTGSVLHTLKTSTMHLLTEMRMISDNSNPIRESR